MDRASAVRLVAKLDALADPARNTEVGERDAARAKASALRRRFNIGCDEPRSAPPPRRVFAAPQHGEAAWDFDIRTGKGSGNVKVHSYTDRANWSIEIPL